MKQKFLIIFINTFLIVFVLFIINFLCFANSYKKFYIGHSHKEFYIENISFIWNEYIKFLKRDISYSQTMNNIIYADDFRPVENKDSNKKPILIFGCSYAYGWLLQNNETLSFKLGQYTKRPIYNRAKPSWGVQHMLFQLQNDEFYKIIPKPEYIIYVYMSSQLHRVVTPVNLNYDNCFSIFYKQKNNKFIPKKRTFFTDKFVIHHYISNKLSWHFFSKYKLYNIYEAKRLNSYLIESKKLAEKNWGKDIKFIIVLFDDIESIKLEEELKKAGFIIMSNKDFGVNLKDKEYKIHNDKHPNEEAWNIITPVLVRKIDEIQ